MLARRPNSRPGSPGRTPSALFEQDLWEQSLLAMAPVQPASMQSSTPWRRAPPPPWFLDDPTPAQPTTAPHRPYG
ncbi:hypothetical protein B1219_17160 [Pseudomonas ogarae]|nr:hypothetical protein B1219_17160 [Pseudomonas ogarae]